MKLYEYNPITKEFTFESNAQIDPITKEPLKRNNSTTTEPLKSKKGFTIVFNESSQNWEYITDLREQDSYNVETKQKEVINYLGEIKEGYTLLIPNDFDTWNGSEWVADIETLKTNKLAEIKSSFDYQESNGTIFVDNDTFEIDARRTDKDNMDDLIKYSDFPIKYVGKTTIRPNTTREDLEIFRKAVFDYGIANYEKKWYLETQVANATTKEELELIKW